MRRSIPVLVEVEHLDEAARRMRDANADILPVCSASNALVGVLTLRDIAFGVVAAGRSLTIPVRDVMTRDVATCRSDDPFFRAQELMRQRRVAFVVCLDDAGTVTGMIDLADVARHEDGFRLAKTVRSALRDGASPSSAATQDRDGGWFTPAGSRRGG